MDALVQAIIGCIVLIVLIIVWLIVITIIFSTDDSNQNVNFWADYNDTSTSDNALILQSEQWTTLPNNGEGMFTNTSYLPESVGTLMDTSTGAFDFSGLSLGDTVYIRNDYTVSPTLNGTHLSVRYLLGQEDSQYTLEKAITTLSDGARTYRISLGIDMIYMGDDNTRNNPVYLQVLVSEEATIRNNGSVIHVIHNK